MTIAELQQTLEDMSEQELSRFIKRCMCQALYGVSKIYETDINIAQDMAYVECARRDNERLYDMACEMVNKNPDICNAA